MFQALFALLATLFTFTLIPPAQAQVPLIPVQDGSASTLQPAQEQPSGFESAAARIQVAQRYSSACRDLRGTLPANSPLRDFSGSPAFIDAITEFCAYGNFILRGQPRGQNCTGTNRLKLDDQQFNFILALNKIGEKIVRVDLECVEYDGRLYLEAFEAVSLRLISSKFRRLFVFGGTYGLGIAVLQSELTQGIGVLDATMNGQLEVNGGRIGNDPTVKFAFATSGTHVRSLRLTDTTIDGTIDITGLKADADIRIEGTTVNGGIESNRANVGSLFRILNSTISGVARMRFMTAGSISLQDKARFKDDVRIDYSTIRDQIWIEDVDFEKGLILTHSQTGGVLRINKSRVKGELNGSHQKVRSTLELSDNEFTGNVWVEYARVDNTLWVTNNRFAAETNMRFSEIGKRVYIANENKFEGGLWLSRMRAPIVELRTSESGKGLQLTGSNIGELMMYGMRVKNDLFIGNARLNVLALTFATVKDKRIESEVGLIDCTDCVIDHYVLIGGKLEQGARLSGARISGSLNFSEGSARASWGRDAVLDLTGVQTQVIQADDSDLRILGADRSCPNQLVEARLTGVKFDTLVGGRVMDMKTEGPVPAGLFNRPVSSLKEWMLTKPSCWNGTIGDEFEHPATSHVRFDPQPFEVFAAALERSGRPEAATELRILKRDEEIKVSNYSKLRRAALWLGRWVVSYGYENEKALLWFALLWFIGWVVYLYAFRPKPVPRAGQPTAWYAPDNLSYGAFYSLDRAVPQLTLDKGMDRYSLVHPVARYYFYLHRVLGACILIYAVAGLTGVLK